MQPNRILIHYAEIVLKGRNRRDFERALRDNIRHRLGGLGLRWAVNQGHHRIYIEVPAESGQALESAVEALREVAGIANINPAVWFPSHELGDSPAELDLAPVHEAMLELARRHYRPDATFAVRVNRADKRYPVRSDQLGRELGSTIILNSDWEKVNLTRPDQAFYLDIYAEGCYCYAAKIRGLGGLPSGCAGRVISLLSGGIDSPVAAQMMAKRGCSVDFVHLTASQSQQHQAANGVVGQLARQLSRYTLRSRLYLIPYTHFDLALMGHNTGYDLVLFRRFMFRTAEVLANKIRAQALVTGDSLGQVASQTLENLVSSSRALEMPILRPLVGLDKLEITERARAIGTYDLSIQPYKDCCALLSDNPRTRSRHAHLEELEREAFGNYEELIERTLADAVCLEFDCGELVAGGD